MSNIQLMSKIQNDNVTYQDTGNSVWKNIKKEANNKARNKHSLSKKGCKIS